MRTRLLGSLLAALLAALCLLVGSSATAATTADVTPAERGKTSLKIVTKSQKKLIRKGAIISVVSTRKKVKLRLRSSTFDNPRLTSLARPKKVKFKGKGKRKKVRIRLSATAREALQDAEPRELQVSARGSKITVPMVRDSAACKPKPST